MASVEELIDRLRDFRTRSSAKTALLELGDKAVEPLIAALQSRNISVRWTAASTLGEIGAKRAVPALIEALDDPNVHSAAVEALGHITGEEFGDDRDAWKRWLEIESGTPPAAGPSAAITDADLNREAVFGTDVSADDRPHGALLRVPLGDRHQDVTLNLRAKDSDDAGLVVVYTRCGPANSKHYEWALRQNVRMSAGAIGIADVEGKPEFVIVDVLPRNGLTPRMLIESVKRVARKGDQLESALLKVDER